MVFLLLAAWMLLATASPSTADARTVDVHQNRDFARNAVAEERPVSDTSDTPTAVPTRAKTLYGIRFGVGGATYVGSAEARFIMVSTGDQSNVDWRRSFQVGFFLEPPSSSMMRYRGEITYARKGGYHEVEVFGVNELTYTSHNLQVVPVMLRLQANPNVQPFAGLYGSVVVAESGTWVDNYQGVRDERNYSNLRTLKTFDTGVTLGSMFRLSDSFRFDVRLDLGVVSVIDQREGYGPDGGSLKNRALTLGLDWVF